MGKMEMNRVYPSTIPAVLKVVDSIIDILLIILVACTGEYRAPGAGGWLFFVAIITLIISMFFFITHLTNTIHRLYGPLTLIEFICIATCAVLHLVAMIVAAATARGVGTAIAAAVFFAVNVILYGTDSFFLFALYRVNGGYLNNPSTTKPPVPPQARMTNPSFENPSFQY